MDEVVDDSEIAIITRRNKENVAMIGVDELSGLLETSYLLRSPKNAERILRSLREVEEGKGTEMTIDELRKSLGL